MEFTPYEADIADPARASERYRRYNRENIGAVAHQLGKVVGQLSTLEQQVHPFSKGRRDEGGKALGGWELQCPNRLYPSEPAYGYTHLVVGYEVPNASRQSRPQQYELFLHQHNPRGEKYSSQHWKIQHELVTNHISGSSERSVALPSSSGEEPRAYSRMAPATEFDAAYLAEQLDRLIDGVDPGFGVLPGTV